MRPFKVIVAATEEGGIGALGRVPWRLPEDLRFFREETTRTRDAALRNAVVMGSTTYRSIAPAYRPLKGRLNVVLTRSPAFRAELGVLDDVLVSGSFEEALRSVGPAAHSGVESVFVIGGGSVYREALQHPLCEEVILTRVFHPCECDVFLPALDGRLFRKTSKGPMQCSAESGLCFRVQRYRRQSEERQYLDLIQSILDHGNRRGDRTGTGTLSLFGTEVGGVAPVRASARQLRFSLSEHVIPLLTTKRLFWRGVVEELLWFLRGDTNGGHLQARNVHIWDGNGSREALDKLGLTDREENDLGPIYGFQWRHFGAEYGTMHDDYSGKGVDQIQSLLETIRSNPTDRRMLLSAWNPAALKKMALPPCHIFAQFYVHEERLSCKMYQRSADVGLGVPFNIASYSLLTILLARMTDLEPGEFIHSMGDTHVYLNHVEALREQIQREPYPFPKLFVREKRDRVEDYVFEDFELVDYQFHPTIKMEMSV